jgi:hypothetical protein
MKLPRRQLFRLVGGATAFLASPYVVRAHAQSPKVAPQGSARDRLEEALARIADPKGEGPRACLTLSILKPPATQPMRRTRGRVPE